MSICFTLSTFLYEGLEYLRILFPYSHSAKECVKRFPGTRWKPEFGFWYLPDPSAVLELKAHLEASGYLVKTLVRDANR